MPYGLMMLGSSTDQYEFVSPTLASNRYCGMASVMPGTSTPASRMLNMTARPRKRNLASAYPGRPDSAAESRAPPPAYSAVLAIQRQYTPFWYAVRSRTLRRKPSPGANVNVLNSSLALFVDATTTQATGSRQYTAPSNRISVGSNGRAGGRVGRRFSVSCGGVPVSTAVA